MLTIPLGIILHKTQQVVQDSLARFKCLKNGKRWGKSKWATYALAKKAGERPGVYWGIFPSYSMAKRISWSDLNFILPSGIVRRRLQQELVVELNNGSEIRLLGSDNIESLRGPRLDGIVMDEASYQDGYCWPGILSGQLLGNKGNRHSFAYFVSSPNRNGRGWFSELWDDYKAKELAGDKEYAAFHYTIFDNETLNQDEVEKLKANTPPDTFQLEYMAEENETGGPVYGQYFSWDKHVTVMDIPSPLLTARGMDWGGSDKKTAHPTVCLFAKVDPERKWAYVYDEYFERGGITEEHASKINRMTGNAKVDVSVIDPSAARKDPNTDKSILTEYRACGIPCIAGDRSARGYDIVKLFLSKGILRIHPKCRNLASELRYLQRGDKDGDDATDALRYLLVHLRDTVFRDVFDSIFHNGYDQEVKEKKSPFQTRPFNLNDMVLFPKRAENQSAFRQEISLF